MTLQVRHSQPHMTRALIFLQTFVLRPSHKIENSKRSIDFLLFLQGVRTDNRTEKRTQSIPQTYTQDNRFWSQVRIAIPTVASTSEQFFFSCRLGRNHTPRMQTGPRVPLKAPERVTLFQAGNE